MDELIKKLTGKDKSAFEYAAFSIVSTGNEEAFKTLVERDNFLFDFIKQNIAKRLSNAVNKDNYKNLLKFLKYYSPSYDEFIVLKLAEFADEDLTDIMLEKLSSGTDEEKAYAAKFFAFVQDSLALDDLRKNAYADFEPLAANCAQSLCVFNDEESFQNALIKLHSDDEFESFRGVKFLVSYGDKRAITPLFEVMKKSSMAENIAGEIFYLKNIIDLLNNDEEDTLLALCNVITGLGDVLPLSCVLDFDLYNIFEILKDNIISITSVVLLCAREKFALLTENDEYLFDEDNNTKNEVREIQKMLANLRIENLLTAQDTELAAESPFVMFAINNTLNINLLKNLLNCNNQTVILHAIQKIKMLDKLTQSDKNIALQKVEDTNIRAIIEAL